MNDSRMKLSLPVSIVIGRGELLEQSNGVDESAGIERCLLHRDHALDRCHRAERVGLEVQSCECGLELEEDERQADLGDRLVILHGHPDIERIAQVGGDRKHQERVGTGLGELPSLSNGGIGRRPREAGHDRDIGDPVDDLQHPDLLVVGEVRPLTGVDVDGQR